MPDTMAPWDELRYFGTPLVQSFALTATSGVQVFAGDPQNVLLVFSARQTAGAPSGVSIDPGITSANCIALVSGQPVLIVDKAQWGPLTCVPWYGIGIAGAGPFGVLVLSLPLKDWPKSSKTTPSQFELKGAINALSKQIASLARGQRAIHDALATHQAR